jgi:hypothetical protein
VEWDAYKLGIIDEKGEVLRKRKTLARREEKNAFGIYDVMLLNIKKLLEKIPGGSTRLGSYAAALYLIREWNHFSDNTMLTEDVTDNELNFEDLSMYVNNIIKENNVNIKDDINSLFEKAFDEDAPTMNVGSGNIAGMGVGPQGEVGFTPSQVRKYKKSNQKTKKFRDMITDIRNA